MVEAIIQFIRSLGNFLTKRLLCASRKHYDYEQYCSKDFTLHTRIKRQIIMDNRF